MAAMIFSDFPILQNLLQSMPLDGAVQLERVDGVVIFLASRQVQERIDALLDKQQSQYLTATEQEELDCYGRIDDYLSFVNRVVRNATVGNVVT